MRRLETLADARAYLLDLPAGMAQRKEWQHAAGKLMEAAAGKVTPSDARDAVMNALVLSLRLDFGRKE